MARADNELNPSDLLREVRTHIASHQREAIAELAERITPHEWADLVPQLSPIEVAMLLQWLPDDGVPAVLAELEPEQAATILRGLSRPLAAAFLEEMHPDDATDIIGQLPVRDAEQILIAMEPADAAEIRELMQYGPETAGGLMTPAFVSVVPSLRVDQAIAALRRVAEEAETINEVYVVDEADRLLGVLSLPSLVLARPERLVADLMRRGAPKVPLWADREVVARLLADHNLLAVPVVDAGDRLMGIITVDDVIDVLIQEFNEDFHRLAGSDAEAMAQRSPLQIARIRLPWLLGTMAIELLAGLIIARYDAVLQQLILLASFMPVISAISGNVGLQAAAIVVRGLDTGHVSLANWSRQVARELSSSLLMALACGLILGSVGAVWSRHLPFGIVIGGALMASMLTAGLMGSVVPMVSKRLGFDPATTAGPFETAFQDVIGFAVFLWLASLLLHWLQ